MRRRQCLYVLLISDIKINESAIVMFAMHFLLPALAGRRLEGHREYGYVPTSCMLRNRAH